MAEQPRASDPRKGNDPSQSTPSAAPDARTAAKPNTARPPAGPSAPVGRKSLAWRVKRFCYRTLVWARDRLPPGIRSLLGLLFCVGGVFGFLPILGFWMFPLGLCLIGLDVPFMRSRLNRVIERLEADLS